MGMSATLKAIKATLNPDGRINSDQPLSITRPTRVILTMVTEDGDGESIDLAVASEGAWGKDWNDPNEETAWAYLQKEPLS